MKYRLILKESTGSNIIQDLYNQDLDSIDFIRVIQFCFKEMSSILNIDADIFDVKPSINVKSNRNFSSYSINNGKIQYSIEYSKQKFKTYSPWHKVYVILHEIGHTFQFAIVGMIYNTYFKGTNYIFKEPKVTYEEEAADIFASYFLLKYCKYKDVKRFLYNFIYPYSHIEKDSDLTKVRTNERHYGNLYNKMLFVYNVMRANKIKKIYEPYLASIKKKSNWVIQNEI